MICGGVRDDAYKPYHCGNSYCSRKLKPIGRGQYLRNPLVFLVVTSLSEEGERERAFLGFRISASASAAQFSPVHHRPVRRG